MRHLWPSLTVALLALSLSPLVFAQRLPPRCPWVVTFQNQGQVARAQREQAMAEQMRRVQQHKQQVLEMQRQAVIARQQRAAPPPRPIHVVQKKPPTVLQLRFPPVTFTRVKQMPVKFQPGPGFGKPLPRYQKVVSRFTVNLPHMRVKIPGRDIQIQKGAGPAVPRGRQLILPEPRHQPRPVLKKYGPVQRKTYPLPNHQVPGKNLLAMNFTCVRCHDQMRKAGPAPHQPGLIMPPRGGKPDLIVQRPQPPGQQLLQPRVPRGMPVPVRGGPVLDPLRLLVPRPALPPLQLALRNPPRTQPGFRLPMAPPRIDAPLLVGFNAPAVRKAMPDEPLKLLGGLMAPGPVRKAGARPEEVAMMRSPGQSSQARVATAAREARPPMSEAQPQSELLLANSAAKKRAPASDGPVPTSVAPARRPDTETPAIVLGPPVPPLPASVLLLDEPAPGAGQAVTEEAPLTRPAAPRYAARAPVDLTRPAAPAAPSQILLPF
jgi:hypothetical protein